MASDDGVVPKVCCIIVDVNTTINVKFQVVVVPGIDVKAWGAAPGR